MTDAYIARKLKRTVTACVVRAKRLGINRKQWLFTKHEVARLFGIDDHKVTDWIGHGYLIARGAPFRVGKHRCWMITAKDLEHFFKYHHDKYDPTRIDREEFPYWRNLGDEWGDANFALYQPRSYTEEQDAFIIRNFATMAIQEIADKLERTELSLRKRIHLLRKQELLPSEPKPHVRYLHRYGLWTKEQDSYLRENFGILADADVVFVVERTVGACRQRARNLGIKRSSLPAPSHCLPHPPQIVSVPQLGATSTSPGATRLELIEGSGSVEAASTEEAA